MIWQCVARHSANVADETINTSPKSGGAETGMNLRMRSLTTLACTVIVSVAASGIIGATAARATPGDSGVGISAAAVTLDGSGGPGGSYDLVPVTVVNTGTRPATIALRVGAAPGADERALPAEWVRLERDRVSLDAGDHAVVGVSVDLPDYARAGAYRSLIYASTSSGTLGDGNAIGAEAATELHITVAAESPGDSAARSWRSTVGTVIAIVCAGLAAVVATSRRRRARHVPASGHGGTAEPLPSTQHSQRGEPT